MTNNCCKHYCFVKTYVIAQADCPNRMEVPERIVNAKDLSGELLNINHDVLPGWCKYQVQTGEYFFKYGNTQPVYSQGHEKPEKRGKPIPGWFPVWITKIGEWY